MTTQSTTDVGSLGRDRLSAARYYLGNRWMLLALGGGLPVGLGLYFGGWSWLVAVGAAPVILSTLPCLIMCGLGVCAMCLRNKSESVSARNAVDTATMLSAPEIANMDASTVAGPSCCQGASTENPANVLAEESTTQLKEKSHA